jgi:hypothetical protein
VTTSTSQETAAVEPQTETGAAVEPQTETDRPGPDSEQYRDHLY